MQIEAGKKEKRHKNEKRKKASVSHQSVHGNTVTRSHQNLLATQKVEVLNWGLWKTETLSDFESKNR